MSDVTRSPVLHLLHRHSDAVGTVRVGILSRWILGMRHTELTVEEIDRLEADLRFGYRPDIQMCQRLLAAARASVCGDWLPIETAPKDGTRILVYRASLPDSWPWPHYKIGIDHWGNQPPELGAWRHSPSPHQPTHWMPLPTEPRPHQMGERREGHSKLVYDKETRTIVTVDPHPTPRSETASTDELVKRLWALAKSFEVIDETDFTVTYSDGAILVEAAEALSSLQAQLDAARRWKALDRPMALAMEIANKHIEDQTAELRTQLDEARREIERLGINELDCATLRADKERLVAALNVIVPYEKSDDSNLRHFGRVARTALASLTPSGKEGE